MPLQGHFDLSLNGQGDRDVPVDWKKENATLQENQEGRFGSLQANQLHLSPW